MNFMLMPSLKHIALVKVTTELWNLSDVRDLVARSSTGYSDYSTKYKEWHDLVEDKVMKKASELPLPELLKNEIFSSIRPIGLEIYRWKTYLCENCSVGVLLSAEEYTKLSSVVYWTIQGIVDQQKTAKALVKDDNLDISKRYILACNLCLEDDIKELFNLLPETKKMLFYDERNIGFSMRNGLTVLVTYDMKGELSKINGQFKDSIGRRITAYQYAFEIAAVNGNRTATEYFFQKLTPVERQESLVRYAEYVAKRRRFPYSRYQLYADVLCFLLSQMNEEQQVKVFEGDSHEVLSSLLDWPWQSFFLEAANCTWDSITVQDYFLILRDIVTKIKLGFKDCNYHKLFTEFWRQGSSTCKKYYIECCASEGVLWDLFQLEDKEKIQLILKSASVKEKENIIFHEGKKICQRLIYLDKWDLLNFFVEECLLSEDVIIKFKQEYKLRITYTSKERSDIDKCNKFVYTHKTKFYQFLDDLIRKNSKKRCVEEGNSSNTAKRHK